MLPLRMNKGHYCNTIFQSIDHTASCPEASKRQTNYLVLLTVKNLRVSPLKTSVGYDQRGEPGPNWAPGTKLFFIKISSKLQRSVHHLSKKKWISHKNVYMGPSDMLSDQYMVKFIYFQPFFIVVFKYNFVILVRFTPDERHNHETSLSHN